MTDPVSVGLSLGGGAPRPAAELKGGKSARAARPVAARQGGKASKAGGEGDEPVGAGGQPDS